MRKVMVRYRVKPERAAENERYIQKVFDELAQLRPSGLHYASFKLDDGVSFMHIASMETPDGRNPLTELAAFKAFSAGIEERCEEPPAFTNLNEVGSYKAFGE